ncbi:multicopper oxidase domain-containing protein [Brachybacterium sp. Z12]|uniref:multicopper oxidase domain-containing protein n=1 Tax=Brachybacterium sp. Z12 TaxID=2759167 RepID=UPI00223BCD3B|nr:multicopper oxidase domain-containing protein [Brachybacterium sp. Z12]
MTFGGTVVGPVLRSELGAQLTVDLVNHGSMGHSLDLHAGTVSPDETMRTIPPGESLEYSITTDHAGIWLYHCSTMPMSVHLAAGMVGALIVPPAGLAEVDREYVLVQSEHYLVPEGAAGAGDAVREGIHPVSPAKIAAERPDLTVFNGHANQYVHAPLEARVGERMRLWVLAAGPSRGSPSTSWAECSTPCSRRASTCCARTMSTAAGRRPWTWPRRRGFRRAGLRRARHLHRREPLLRGDGARGAGPDQGDAVTRRAPHTVIP